MVAVVRAGVSSVDACRVLSLVGDTTTSRLIELSFLQHGEPPCAWSWMALGSVARRELTLASDQDNAFAYADPGGDEVDAFFKAVATDVNDGLERCGFGADNAEVMARNRQWRMSQSEWSGVFADCLEQPDRSHLVRAAVAFDFRHVEGGLDIVRPLTSIERQAPSHPDFVRRLARTATDWETPLNRRRRIATADDGTIDLKRQAIIPIVNLARFHAIANGITISSTLERLVAAQAAGSLPADEATELREAFELVLGLRIEHQVACIEARRPPDDRLDVGALSSLARTQLEHTLRAVAEAQKRLGRYAPIGL
jgi:CBS domain-containing protein